MFSVQCLEFRLAALAYGLRFRLEGFRVEISGSGFRVSAFVLRLEGSGILPSP